MTTTRIAAAATEYALTRGGATWNVSDNAPVESGGAAVALPGHEVTVPVAWAEEAVAAYVEERADLLALPRVFLGLWICDDTLYLDLAEVLPVEDAIAAGRERGEQAVYDLDSGTEIPTTDAAYAA